MGTMSGTRKIALRLVLLVGVIGVLSVVLLAGSAMILNRPTSEQPQGPTLVIGSERVPLPPTTEACRTDVSSCPPIAVPSGATVTFAGVDSALGLSSASGAELRPAVHDTDGWTVELPEEAGTMLVTSGEEIWSLLIG